MNWKKLLTTALLWYVVISTPAGSITTHHTFGNASDCQNFLLAVTNVVNNPQSQKEVNSMSNIHVNSKGLAILSGQAKCVEQ